QSFRRWAARHHGRPPDAAALPRRSTTSCVPQLRPQAFAGARQPGLDCPDGNTKREPDLVVTEAVDFANDHGGPLIEPGPLEGGADAVSQLLAAEHAIGGRPVGLFRQIAVIADVLVERHLLRPMPAPPPALAVPRLVHDDPIDPGAEGRLASKTMDGSEH